MYKPRIGKILKNDYLAVLSLIAAIAIPVSLVLASLTGVAVTRRFRVIRVENDIISMIPVLILIFAAGMLLFYFRSPSSTNYLNAVHLLMGKYWMSGFLKIEDELNLNTNMRDTSSFHGSRFMPANKLRRFEKAKKFRS